MNRSSTIARACPDAAPIRSVELPRAKMSLLFRHGDLDVLVSEIDAQGALSAVSPGCGFSWHLVVEGRALFEQDALGWEVLPAHSLSLPGTKAYRIANLGQEPLRLVSIVVGSAADEPAPA